MIWIGFNIIHMEKLGFIKTMHAWYGHKNIKTMAC